MNAAVSMMVFLSRTKMEFHLPEKSVGRGDHMILFYQAPEVYYIGNARYLKKTRYNYPILKSAEIHHSVIYRRFNNIAENFINRSG